MTSFDVAEITTWAGKRGCCSQRAVESVITSSRFRRANRAIESKWALLAHVLFERADLVLESASGAWLWLYCSFDAEVSCGAIKASQVCYGGLVAVVTSSAVVAIVLVNLFGLRVPCAKFAFVLSFRVQHAVADWWTVVTHGAFSGCVISFRTKVAGLATCTLVDLFGCCDHTLRFKWTVHRPVVAFWTVVTSCALFAWWVWLSCVVGFRTKIAGCAVISNQVCAAIVGGGANSAISVSCVEIGAGRTQWLSLLST